MPPGFRHNAVPSKAVPFMLLGIVMFVFFIFAVEDSGERGAILHKQVQRGEVKVSFSCTSRGCAEVVTKLK